MPARRLGVLLAFWSAGFAVVHGAWALGWRGGVPGDVPPIAERPWFLFYDVAAGVAMLAAAVVALLLARGGLTRSARRRLTTLTLVGAGAALLRGVPALTFDVVWWPGFGLGVAADLWFVLAGLGGVALWAMAQPESLSPKNDRIRSIASC